MKMLAQKMQAVSKRLEKKLSKASESDGNTLPHLTFGFQSCVHNMNSILLANTRCHLEQPSFGQNYMLCKYARTSVFFSSAYLMPAL
jgi:hypothetical protein